MTVNITKPAINLRSELADLRKPSGVAGEAMLRAETPQEQFNLIGAGRRNILINGAMRISQRGGSFAGNSTAGYYGPDRWKSDIAGLGTWTVSQEADGPNGFANSIKVLCTTATASPSASQNYYYNQRLEGKDLQMVAKGTSEAKYLTMSFWVKSNVTGVYTAEIYDSDNTRHCGQAYTVNTVGVWEYKSVTFPPDTTGAWANDFNLSAYVAFWLGGGTTFSSGTFDGQWTTSDNKRHAEGQVNLASAVNNYFQITGVQLELGKVATPFEHRSYGEELAMCQRYCYVIGHPSQIIYLGTGSMYTTTTANLSVPLPVQLRGTAPSFTRVANGTGNWLNVYIGATGTVSNATPLAGDYVQGNVRIYIPGAHSGSSPSAVGAGVWSMVLAGAKLIIETEL